MAAFAAKKKEGQGKGLPSRGPLAAKDHASGCSLRDQSVLLVNDIAFYIADCVAPLYDDSFCFQMCLPDWAEEVDLQFDRREGFLFRESARERHPHGGVSNVAKDPAV